MHQGESSGGKGSVDERGGTIAEEAVYFYCVKFTLKT